MRTDESERADKDWMRLEGDCKGWRELGQAGGGLGRPRRLNEAEGSLKRTKKVQRGVRLREQWRG